jgi:hypothetical protein
MSTALEGLEEALDIVQSRIDDCDTERSLLESVRKALQAPCPPSHHDGDTELIEAHAKLKTERDELRKRVAYLEERLGVVSVEADNAGRTVADIATVINRGAIGRKP